MPGIVERIRLAPVTDDRCGFPVVLFGFEHRAESVRPGLGIDDLILLSSKTGYGLKDLWARIEEAAE